MVVSSEGMIVHFPYTDDLFATLYVCNLQMHSRVASMTLHIQFLHL